MKTGNRGQFTGMFAVSAVWHFCIAVAIRLTELADTGGIRCWRIELSRYLNQPI